VFGAFTTIVKISRPKIQKIKTTNKYIEKTYIFVYTMIYFIHYETELSHKYIDFLLDFCHDKRPHDIICVIKNKKDLRGRIDKFYYKYKKTLLFGIKEQSEDIFVKCLQNLIYGTWNNEMVQEDVFVGPVNLICDFWKDIGSKENIHKYAMTKMKNQRFSNVFDYTYDLDYESNIFHKKIIETGEDKVSMFAIVFVVFSAIYLFRFSVVFIWKYI
jgi:hypothetical protein